MRHWITAIEKIWDGPEADGFFIGMTEYDEDGEISDFDEPAASAGRVFYSAPAARAFADHHGIRLSTSR